MDEKTIKTVKDAAYCAGCSACASLCPAKAIEMKLDAEGFYKPVLDETLCTGCGTCIKACPMMHPVYTNSPEPACFAVMASDEIRAKSSSGGMFSLLAEQVLLENGYVCGAVFSEDYRSVYHTIVSDEKGLDQIRLSKYLQSAMRACYARVRELLDLGSKVLFSGCPCQVAGLYAFLGGDREKLLTVDLVCHGANSVKAYNKFLDDREREASAKVARVSFREKARYGWSSTTDIWFDNGTEYYRDVKDCLFYNAFLANITLNEACYHCPFTDTRRMGDITIADFWGIHTFNHVLDDGRGTSLVLVNSNKGAQVCGKLEYNVSYKIPLEVAIKGNAHLKVPPSRPANRDEFFSKLENLGFDRCTKLLVKNKYDIGIVGIPNILNFGGSLTYFALYNTIFDMGYLAFMTSAPSNINLPELSLEDAYENTPYDQYVLKNNYSTKAQMTFMNDLCDTFLVGSDQLFNEFLYHRIGEIITLDWVKDNHKKIAYAASFGHDSFYGDERTRSIMAHYMQKFDAFSVRELDGINIARDFFSVDAEWVLDPIFLCDQSHYKRLITNYLKKKTVPHVFAYILDPSVEKNRMLEYIKDKFNMHCEIFSEMFAQKNLQKISNEQFTLPLLHAKIEKRLYSLITAKFIITDSFHGACFAIIFKLPFIAILNKKRGASRFLTILSKLNLKDRLVSSLDEIKRRPELFDAPNYVEVYKILDVAKKHSLQWLKAAIEKRQKKAFSSDDIMTELMNNRAYELRMDNRYLEVKINALLRKPLFIRETDIYKYLNMLRIHKNRSLLIIFCVRDTPGYFVDDVLVKELAELGLQEDLRNKHWHSYIGILNNGALAYENLSKGFEESRFEESIDGITLKVVSKSVKAGDIGVVFVNDKDYSENRRGINIVLYDKNLNEVIDSVNFDTHRTGVPCYRARQLRGLSSEASRKHYARLLASPVYPVYKCLGWLFAQVRGFFRYLWKHGPILTIKLIIEKLRLGFSA